MICSPSFFIKLFNYLMKKMDNFDVDPLVLTNFYVLRLRYKMLNIT